MSEDAPPRKGSGEIGGPALAHPRWWPTWIGLGLLWLVAQTPWRFQRGLGRLLGRLLHALHRQRRHIAAVNLELCFPELEPAQRRRLLRQNFEALGISLFEMATAWWGPERRLRSLFVLRGREHLAAALERGNGVILLQGHFLTTDIGGQLLGMTIPFTATYAPPRNPVMRRLTERLRGRHIAHQLHHSRVREIVRELQANHVIWHGPDQSPSRRTSVEARFFGYPALSSVSTAKLARASGAAVVPYHPVRLPNGRYELRLEPPLADFPGDDLAAATQRVNDVLESHIRAAPEQYLWAHKRFKRVAEGAPDPYA
ncbi:MAG: lipid A biosynthesis acyltransferase [Halofilum sp. (in: g-proteobacteria)]|nr:lipid A biosynthesis acyltransferase [Halofilum sp. (in: g-proteobacteria)]